MGRPNFFIIGSPKCGTTALSQYLSQHPNIFVSHPKEPHFFCVDFPKMRGFVNEDEYLSIFDAVSDEHKAVGEASVWYMYSKEAVERIQAFEPNAKIIIMLRNPVDLVYSMHAQNLNSVDENIKDFEAAWRLQFRRAKGIDIPKRCREPAKLLYGEVGKLGDQVERVKKIIPEGRLKIILFDEFTKNTASTFGEVLEFLEVPNEYSDIDFRAINKNKVDRFTRLANFYRRKPKKLVAFFMWFKKVLRIKRWNLSKALLKLNIKEEQRKLLTNEFRSELIEFFSKDIDKLGLIIRKDLSNWKK